MKHLTPPEHVIRLLRDSGSVVIIPHSTPDADALGSSLALHLALKTQGKSSLVLADGFLSHRLQFLPNIGEVVWQVNENSTSLLSQSDLIVVCDTSEPTRVGGLREHVFDGHGNTKVVVIDHHIGRPPAESFWVEPQASSTAEMMVTVIQALGGPITPEIATCLAAGIVDDTAHFSNTNSTSSALGQTAVLVDKGADLNRISTFLDSPGPFRVVRLWGELIAQAQSDLNGSYVWTLVRQEALAKSEVKEQELEGLSNYLRSIDGVAVSAAFFEQSTNSTRVSIRARRGYDVRQIASQYPGGGGHPLAAGCTVPKSIEEAERDVRDKVVELISTGMP